MKSIDEAVHAGPTVFYAGKPGSNPSGHEAVTQRALARKLAGVRGSRYGGDWQAQQAAAAKPLAQAAYLVPADTLSADTAERLGVRGEQDLFGGVVPYPFVATKVISHGLIAAHAAAPEGWSSAFAEQVREVTLAGYSTFTLDDAREAGKRLLVSGAVRIKPALGVGGLGQSVVQDEAALEQALSAIDPVVLSQGVVLEPNLSGVQTYSIGRVHIGELVVTYHGTQRQTRDNQGGEVYGGSDLVLVRGDFDVLLARELAPEIRCALEQANLYHAAALRCFPGLFASRCNYDVVRGQDHAGVPHTGVLEQSWRIGGATGAELAAVEAFLGNPALDTVRACSAEVYGAPPLLPEGATLYFSDDDPRVGRLTKYAWIEGYGNA